MPAHNNDAATHRRTHTHTHTHSQHTHTHSQHTTYTHTTHNSHTSDTDRCAAGAGAQRGEAMRQQHTRPRHLHKAGVHHEAHPVDGHRGFRNVGGQNYLTVVVVRCLKRYLLHIRGERSVQWAYLCYTTGGGKREVGSRAGGGGRTKQLGLDEDSLYGSPRKEFTEQKNLSSWEITATLPRRPITPGSGRTRVPRTHTTHTHNTHNTHTSTEAQKHRSTEARACNTRT